MPEARVCALSPEPGKLLPAPEGIATKAGTQPHRAGNADREDRSTPQGHRVPGACTLWPKQQPGKLNNDATALKPTEAAPANASAYNGLAKQ